LQWSVDFVELCEISIFQEDIPQKPTPKKRKEEKDICATLDVGCPSRVVSR
jgi:hypothetical protein